MKDWTEEELEKFIRDNKDALVDGCRPVIGHEVKFMTKLKLRMKSIIDITPYLIKVVVVTIIVFLCSIFIWYNFMCKDKTKPVYENIVNQFKKDKK
jgi:hypothetical protein